MASAVTSAPGTGLSLSIRRTVTPAAASPPTATGAPTATLSAGGVDTVGALTGFGPPSPEQARTSDMSTSRRSAAPVARPTFLAQLALAMQQPTRRGPWAVETE